VLSTPAMSPMDAPAAPYSSMATHAGRRSTARQKKVDVTRIDSSLAAPPPDLPDHTDPSLAYGQVERYYAHEFVLASPDQRLVLGLLGERHVRASIDDRYLGLTLVRLFREPGAVESAVAHVQAERKVLGLPDPPATATANPMDQLMSELRYCFAARYGGWAPTMGKNRLVHGVQFYPYPDFGAAGLPHPTRARAMSLLGAPDAGRDVRVGVLDTDLYPHDGLRGKYYAPSHVLLGPARRQADETGRDWRLGHSAFVSGLIVQRAPAVELDVRSVLDEATGTASIWEVAQRLVRFGGSGVEVVNLSLGCFTDDGQPPLVLTRAIDRLAPEIVVVAAGGNHGDTAATADSGPPTPVTPIWPAAFDKVIAVGATDATGAHAPFNPPVPWLAMLAPGVDVESFYLHERVELPPEQGSSARVESFTGMAKWSGTSFAAAAVSGAIAAMTRPGRVSAREAVDQLMGRQQQSSYGQPVLTSGEGIVPAG
jgi:membrane-anchored mycosin MYCP